MSSLTLTLPNSNDWPLQVFLFARWNRNPAPPPGTQASWKDLKYYLRAMRGPHWKMTVPLCVHEGTEQDVKMLETALAYMETPWCEKWFHPMEAWTATRVFLIIVHARAAQHPLMKSYDWDSYRDLIAHVTPYRREPEALDMWTTIAGLARLAKQFFPTEIFHYRRICAREHTQAASVMFDIRVWSDVEIQTEQPEIEAATEDIGKDAMEIVRGDLDDGYESDVHRAEDPREVHDICIHARNLPRLDSYGILVQIPLPPSS